MLWFIQKMVIDCWNLMGEKFIDSAVDVIFDVNLSFV